MNNNRLTASKSKAALEEQSYDLIQQHIIDPENSPLPEHLRVQCNRILQISRLLDDYPNESHIINIMLAKYRISRTQIRKDIALAKELFKTQHQFDWDFWYAWMIKDQIQLIRDCKLKGDLKQWNNAKKVLHQMIGEKPASVEDPRRMEKNVFYIQINSMGQKGGYSPECHPQPFPGRAEGSGGFDVHAYRRRTSGRNNELITDYP